MAMRSFLSRSGIRFQCHPAVATSTFSQGGLQRMFANVVDGLKYQSSHEWAKESGDTITVGVSDFAQAQLGDIVYVELPEVGSEVTKSEQFGVVESVKAASDVYSPVSGEVTEVNSKLVDDPSTVNQDPFEEGWFMKVKPSQSSEMDSLMDSEAYKKKCDEEDADH